MKGERMKEYDLGHGIGVKYSHYHDWCTILDNVIDAPTLIDTRLSDLLAFADHVRRERGGAMVPEHHQEIEKREFVRRAAIAMCAAYGTEPKGHMTISHHEAAVIHAQKLWDALQEKGL